MPANRVSAHTSMVSEIRPHKPDTLRVRITVGGGNIELNYDVGTPTTELSTAKILINSTLYTPGAKWCGFELVSMYLNTGLTTNEYLKIHINRIPQEFIYEYDLNEYVTPDGWVFAKIRKGMFGLPQAGILAHNKLKKVLKTTVTLLSPTPQDYGATTQDLSHLLSSSMILVSSM